MAAGHGWLVLQTTQCCSILSYGESGSCGRRNAPSIFVAPHASNVPLIGGGWGGAREAAFCEFLTQAAAQGLAVQLAASSTTTGGDIEFIRKCASGTTGVPANITLLKSDDNAAESDDGADDRAITSDAGCHYSPASLCTPLVTPLPERENFIMIGGVL